MISPSHYQNIFPKCKPIQSLGREGAPVQEDCNSWKLMWAHPSVMWLLYYLTRIISWPNLCSSHMASDSDAIFLKGYSSHVCQFSFPNAHTLMHFPLSSVFRFQICNFIVVCGVDVINQHAHTQLAPILSSQMLANGSLSRSGLLF